LHPKGRLRAGKAPIGTAKSMALNIGKNIGIGVDF